MPHEPDPTAEEQVRRLLADARHTEPMPDDVVARLDAVLSDLAAGDGAGPPRIPDGSAARAADLAAARRRRTVRNLLVAAAAIVAVGIGLNEADLTVSGGDADSASSGAADAPVAGAEAAPSTSESDNGVTAQDAQPGATELQDDGMLDFDVRESAVRLSADRFGTQVRRLQVQPKFGTRGDVASATTPDQLFSLGRNPLRAGCSTRGWGAGRLVPVRYDGDLGALVFRKATGDTQVVDLFLCGNDEPSRSITLPAR